MSTAICATSSDAAPTSALEGGLAILKLRFELRVRVVELRGLEPLTLCLQSTFTLSVIVAGLGMNPSPVRLNRPSSGLVVVRRGGQAIAFILAFRPLTTASASAGRAIQKFVAETSINVLTELFSIGGRFPIPQYPQHQKP